MAWTAPRTWVALEIVTSGNLNTHIRDNLGYLYDVLFDGILSGDSALWLSPQLNLTAPNYANYRSLTGVVVARSSVAAVGEALYVRFNQDAGANYDWEYLSHDGAITASEGYGQNQIFMGTVTGNTADAGSYSAHWFTIPNFNVASRPKHFNCLNGQLRTTGAGATHQVLLNGGVWRTGDALSQLSFFAASGQLKAGSRFSFYGDLL